MRLRGLLVPCGGSDFHRLGPDGLDVGDNGDPPLPEASLLALLDTMGLPTKVEDRTPVTEPV